MASSKEMLQSSRPLTQQQRPSISHSPASGLAGRQSHSRTGSSSLLTGALNANHRVTRRKSITQNPPTAAALTAALRETESNPSAVPITNGARRHTMSKPAGTRPPVVGSLPVSSGVGALGKSLGDSKQGLQGSAIDDDSNSADEDDNKAQKARMRRASDGQPLAKEGRKSNRVEVRCETCGKSYKHSSCLIKHRWEHTPQWSVTSKLLISKHQQVQLLEAASVLVNMNINDGSATPPESTKDNASESESMSPAASGYSERGERLSSAGTTPPPAHEAFNFGGNSYRNKRLSSQGGFSRSYQSAPSMPAGSIPAGSMPASSGLGHNRNPSIDRPTSSGNNATSQEDRDLAANLELLSCSYGSNNGNGTVTLPGDVPPVPPLPAQYLDQATSLHSNGFISSFPRQQESFTRGARDGAGRSSKDVKMEDSADSDDDFDMHSRARSEDEDDGIFGRMEE